MTDKLTISDLRDETVLRRTIAEVLNPRHWKHDLIHDGLSIHDCSCTKCGRKWYKDDEMKDDCPFPTPDTRPMPVLVQELVKLFATPSLVGLKLWKAIEQVYDHLQNDATWGDTPEDLMWFILWATPKEKAICCLLALLPEKVKVGK